MRHSLRLATLGATALMLAGLAPAMRAQDSSSAPPPPNGGMHGGRGMRGGGHRPDMDQALLHGITLTDTQRDSIKVLHDSSEAQMRAAWTPGSGRPDSTTRTKMMAMRTQHVADIRAVLTSDQQTQFDKNVAEMQKRMSERRTRGPGGGGPPPDSAPPNSQ